MNKEDNRRTRMTRKMLQGALLDLLEEQPLSKINVSKLCERADLNRSTFYAHFKSPQDLLNNIRDTLQQQAPQFELSAPLEDKLSRYLSYIRENGRTFHILFHLNESFQEEMIRALANYLDTTLLELPKEDSMQKTVQLYFLASGVAHSIDLWIQKKYPVSEAEFAGWLLQYVRRTGNVLTI